MRGNARSILPWMNRGPLETSVSRKTIRFDAFECEFYGCVEIVREVNKIIYFRFRNSKHREYVINKSLPEEWFVKACI